MSGSDELKFRLAVLPAAGVIMVSTFFVSGAYILVRDWGEWDVFAMLFGLASLPVISLFFASLLAWLFPTRLSESSLHAFDAFAIPMKVAFEDIERVSLHRLFHRTFLRIHPRNSRRVMWLARFHSREAEFRRELATRLPADSPLLPYLSEGTKAYAGATPLFAPSWREFKTILTGSTVGSLLLLAPIVLFLLWQGSAEKGHEIGLIAGFVVTTISIVAVMLFAFLVAVMSCFGLWVVSRFGFAPADAEGSDD